MWVIGHRKKFSTTFLSAVYSGPVLSVPVISVTVMSSPSDQTAGSPLEGMTGPMQRFQAAVEEVLAVDPLVLSDTALLVSLQELERGIRRLPAARHGLVAEIDARGVAESQQQRSTRDLLRVRLNLSRGEAGSWVKQATEQAPRRDLTTGEPRPPRLASVAAAVRAGVLSAEQAQLISATMRRVPSGVSTARRDALEADLVAHAGDLSPEELARVCRHALDVLDEDGPPPPEELDAKVGLVFGKTRVDGLTPFKGIADPETKAVLEAALAPLAKPVKSEHRSVTPGRCRPGCCTPCATWPSGRSPPGRCRRWPGCRPPCC